MSNLCMKRLHDSILCGFISSGQDWLVVLNRAVGSVERVFWLCNHSRALVGQCALIYIVLLLSHVRAAVCSEPLIRLCWTPYVLLGT